MTGDGVGARKEHAIGDAHGPRRRRSQPPARPRCARPSRRPPSSRASTSCTSATGSPCSSTRARSSRTASWPTRWPRTCPPTAWSPAAALVDGRPALVVANDPTVKAGSWGARTVEKIVRIDRGRAARRAADLLVHRLRRRPDHRPGGAVPGPSRRRADLPNQVALSGKVPQICCLFGPSAAGGAYIPAFCDIVIMVEGNASMYLGSPRMAEMVVGEKVTLEEMGGARMHATVSGCGDLLAADDADAIELAKAVLLLPAVVLARPAAVVRRRGRRRATSPPTWCPSEESVGYDIHDVIDALARRRTRSSRSSRSYAPELVVGFGLLDGQVVGVVANNPAVKGGVLFVDSRRQGGPVHLAVRRVQRAAGLPRRRTRLHDRQRGRAAGHHPARREDDHRGGRGDRADGVGDRPEGVRRRALRDVRARASHPTPASPCRPRRSR